ncbi:MAG: diguanylate cyclase [Firmicutes bacterium]|nr:diguanylate cyclase [Bacillota bacterium]
MVVTTNQNKAQLRKTAVILAGFCMALFGVLNFMLKPGERTTDIVLRGLYVIPIIGAFICSTWASRKSSAYKKLWTLMSIGMFFWMTGELIFFGYVVKYGIAHVPSPTIADAFSIAYVPIILGVLFSLGRIRAPFDSEKKLFLANVTMLALAAFLLCYKFLLLPQWYENPAMSVVQKTYAIAYPIMDWIIIVSLLLASRRFLEGQIEGWLVLLVAAFSFSIFSDIIFYLADNQRNPYTTWSLMVTASLIAMSSIDEVTGSLVGNIEHHRAESKGAVDSYPLAQKPWRTLVIPSLASSVIPIIWLAYAYNSNKAELPVLVAISSLLLIILIYRNHLLVTDNTVLFAKALRDSLTGLNNHRYFHETLNKGIKRAAKNNRSLSLMMLDIDNFAQLNNSYGHVFGDRVLVTVGAAILTETREEDEACRLSGDEFGVICPNTTGEEAQYLAERMKMSIKRALSKGFPDKGITVSIGISTYPELAKDKDELLHTTDGALYWAKLNGKNRIQFYDPKVVKILSAEERAKRAEEITSIDMVRNIAKAVDARDPYTRLHSKRVSDLAKKLARFMGLDEDIVNRVEMAGMLHDVGKIGIPDNILKKQNKLSGEEITIIRNHPLLSVQIIRSTSLKDIIPAVKAHHERWDGSGYPQGLKGGRIPIEARILAIADAYDAMTTDRPYRKGLTVDEALGEIRRCSGSQFDPKIVDKFLAMFSLPGLAFDAEDGLETEFGLKLDKALGF